MNKKWKWLLHRLSNGDLPPPCREKQVEIAITWDLSIISFNKKSKISESSEANSKVTNTLKNGFSGQNGIFSPQRSKLLSSALKWPSISHLLKSTLI